MVDAMVDAMVDSMVDGLRQRAMFGLESATPVAARLVVLRSIELCIVNTYKRPSCPSRRQGRW